MPGAGLSNISASNESWRSWKLYIHGEGPYVGLLMVRALSLLLYTTPNFAKVRLFEALLCSVYSCVCRQQGAQSAGYPDGEARAAQPQHLPVRRDPGQAQQPGDEGAAQMVATMQCCVQVDASAVRGHQAQARHRGGGRLLLLRQHRSLDTGDTGTSDSVAVKTAVSRAVNSL